MRLTDLTVEVRDLTLTRLGQVPPHALDFSATVVDSAPGEWHIRLPADHEMADPLRTPGAGIIVTGPDGVIFSGPMTRAEVESTWEDQTGVLVADGVTDEIILWDTLAYPTPDFDWSGLFMPDAYWSDTGLAWEVMGQLVLDQIIDSGRFDGLLGGLLDLDLSAVDGSGSPGPNLIPNPEPLPVELEEDGYSSYIGSGWSDNGSYGNQWRILTDFGPEGASDSCYRGIFQFSVGDWRIFATDAGTSAPAVAAGTYRVTFHAQTESYDEGIAVLAGVIWYDGSGDVISTSLGDPVALEANGDPGPRWYTPSDPEYDYSPPSIWAGNTAYVQSDFTAPEGAAHARPFSQWDLPSGADTDYCLMSAAYLGVLS